MKAYVTKLGVVSSIGHDVDENFNSLKDLRTGLKFSDKYGVMAGEIDQDNDQIRDRFGLKDQELSRTTLLGIWAVSEAWKGQTVRSDIRTGFISATSVGGMDRIEEFYYNLKKGDASSHQLMTHDNGRCTEQISKFIGITGYIDTISTACSSGANSVMQGTRMISSGLLDRLVVGGSEPLAMFDVKGFSSLNIYDEDICKPFDDDRKGLNLGEAAAYMILESEECINRTGNEPICMVSGYGNATDAYHQTASSAEGIGASMTMSRSLEMAGIRPEEVSYINAHGTGTGNNDMSESVAFRKVFGEDLPPFSSTKGYTGHALGAAGALEAVFCVMTIQNDCILPNLNFKTPIKETGMIPQVEFMESANIRHVLTNSFGFGGNCTSLLFSSI